MLKKAFLYLAIILFFGTPIFAQSESLKMNITRIDSLLYFDKMSEASKIIDSLQKYLLQTTSSRELIDTKLKLKLHQAYILARADKISKSLQLSLEIADKAKKSLLPEKEFKAYLMIETMYEYSSEFDLCRKFLDKAYTLTQQHDLDSIISIYYVRSASYFRLNNQKDSALIYAQKALPYAEKYRNWKEITDANFLIAMLLPFDQYKESIKHYLLAIKDFRDRQNSDGASIMFNNIATLYFKHKDYAQALAYCDSALLENKNLNENNIGYNLFNRFRIYDSLGNVDSALLYFKQYHNAYVQEQNNQIELEIKKVTELYNKEKSDAVIKNKNTQLILLSLILLLVVNSVLLLLFKNKKIKKQNKTINKQMADLVRVLEHKQVLLSELQHRVKNNLQHVISIMEIQKESMDFNNIEELVRENQNRVLSMALIHKKLNISENVNEVNLATYIKELSDLIVDSYENLHKKVHLNLQSNIESINIEQAHPIGLILVELISNSMKYAFNKQPEGVIFISVNVEKDNQKKTLYYSDNGSGYDFYQPVEKGLGVSIVKGLIDQLDATVQTNQKNGFEISIQFN